MHTSKTIWVFMKHKLLLALSLLFGHRSCTFIIARVIEKLVKDCGFEENQYKFAQSSGY